MKNQTIDPTEGPLLSKIILYALPIAATGLLQLLFNAADLVVVGRFCGSNSVAAVGATGSLTGLLINLFIGLSVGVGVTSAHALGARNDEAVRRTVHTAVPTAILFGLVMLITGVVFSPALLEIMGTPEEVIGLSSVYMRIYFLGMPGTMLCNFGIAILRAAGDTRSPLIYLSLSGVINVILNVIFVTLLHMDVAGVALATLISGTLSAVLVLITLMCRKDACRFVFRQTHIYKEQLLKIFAIGFPAGIQSSMFAISNVLIQSSINSFGADAISGSSAAGSIEGFLSTAMDSISQTAMNFTGLCVGAGRRDRIPKILRLCLSCVVLIGLPVGIVVYLNAAPLLSIYIPNAEEAIAFGVNRMFCMSIFWFLGGTMNIVSGVLRGMGRSFQPMIMTIIGVCVFRIIWIYTVFAIPEFHTFRCLFWSYPISWGLTTAAQLLAYFRVIRQPVPVPVAAGGTE